MTTKLEEWIKDAEAYDILRSFNVENSSTFEFEEGDGKDRFYVTLLNKFFFTLKRADSVYTREVKIELLQVAKGLILYSNPSTANNFTGVNCVNNMLYVATIYYLCGYKAISILLVKKINNTNFLHSSTRLLHYILSGMPRIHTDIDDIQLLFKKFMDTGNFILLKDLQNILDKNIETSTYASLNDFFDTHILLHVIKAFQTDNLWVDLLKYESYDFWRDYVAFSSRNRILSFLPSQRRALDNGMLTFNRSFSLQMPTSAGKTYITELLIYQELKSNQQAKVLYLAPLRSLNRELRERYSKIARVFKFDYRAAYGGSSVTMDENKVNDAQLLITTPETFMSLEGTIDHFLNDFTLVICDEGQLLDERSRGISYELLLSRLKRNNKVRFLFISAIIPNINQINTWLGGTDKQIGDSKYRPCKIRLGIAMKKDGKNYLLYADEEYKDFSIKVEAFLNNAQMTAITDKQKDYSCALALKAMDGGPVMLYCSMKDWHRGCISHSAKIWELIIKGAFRKPIEYISQPNDSLAEIVEYFAYQLGKDYCLTKYLNAGYAYHHGQLPQDLRELIEKAFADKQLYLICCTNTLAEGINMPVKTIVLANITDTSSESYNKSLNNKDLKNIIGRAGRAGKENYGIVILPFTGNSEPVSKVVEVLKNENIEQTRGTLYEIVEILSKKGNLDENGINEELDRENMSSAIDQMITLNTEGDDLEQINIEEVIHDSLAYYLGDENIKSFLERIFKVRYNYLKEKLGKEHFASFKNSGLQTNEYLELQTAINREDIEKCFPNTATDDKWITYITNVVYNLDSVKYMVNGLSKSKPLKSILTDTPKVAELVKAWLTGQQYKEMAVTCDTTVEQAALFADHIQKIYAVKVQSIIRFVKKCYGIDNEILLWWSDMLKRGVSSRIALRFIDEGLSDRIVTNKLVEYASIVYHFTNNEDKIIELLMKNESTNSFINSLEIPTICKKKWEDFWEDHNM